MLPLVSILIPAYNAAEWVEESIQSGLSQTWPRKEIIVVDDGSVDGTLLVARRFESQGVKVVSQPNQGGCAARNAGLSLCQGDYIQWLDADDILAPEKISVQLAARSRGGCSRALLSSSWGKFFYRRWKAEFEPSSLWEDLSPAEWMIRKMEENAWMAPESWLVPRELTEQVGPWNTGLLLDQDGEYFSRLVRASSQVVFVAESKSYYRMSNLGSVSRAVFSEAKLESLFQSTALQIRYLQSVEDTPRSRAACRMYLQRVLLFFYPEKQALVKRANALATDLGGGDLEVPQLRWKYAVLRQLFGWSFAKKVLSALPRVRARISCGWDRLLAAFERPRGMTSVD